MSTYEEVELGMAVHHAIDCPEHPNEFAPIVFAEHHPWPSMHTAPTVVCCVMASEAVRQYRALLDIVTGDVQRREEAAK